MKESKLLEMQNKIVALTNVAQQMINELNHSLWFLVVQRGTV